MKKIFALLVGTVFLVVRPVHGFAGDGKPAHDMKFSYSVRVSLLDSLPSNTTKTDNATDKPPENIIKEVPKSRKQQVPVPVTVQVKPIKIVKPKIIKPVVKVLH